MVRWIVGGWQDDYHAGRNWAAPPRVTVLEQLDALPILQAFRPPYREAPRTLPILLSQRFSVGASPTVTLAPADTFIGRELARLDIDAAGKVSSCKVVETTGTIPPQLSRACLITAKQYARKKDAKGTPAPFTAYFMINLFGP
jgi:hypothetical protein